MHTNKECPKRFSTLLPREVTEGREERRRKQKRAAQRLQRLQVLCRLLADSPEVAFLHWRGIVAKRQQLNFQDRCAAVLLFSTWRNWACSEARARRQETSAEELRGRLATMQLLLVKERRSRRLADARATLAGAQVLAAKLPAGLVGAAPIRAIEEIQGLCFAAWQLRTAGNALRRGLSQPQMQHSISTQRTQAEFGNLRRLRLRWAAGCYRAWWSLCSRKKSLHRGQQQALALARRRGERTDRRHAFAAWAAVAHNSLPRLLAAKVASRAYIATKAAGQSRVFSGWRCAAVESGSEKRLQQEARASAVECHTLHKKAEELSIRLKERSTLRVPRRLSKQVICAWRLVIRSSRQAGEACDAWRRARDFQSKVQTWRTWERWALLACERASRARLILSCWRGVGQLLKLERHSAEQLEALRVHASAVTEASRSRVRKALRGAFAAAAASQLEGLRRLCFERWRLAASAAGKKEAAKTEVLALRLMTEQLRAAQRQCGALQQALCSEQRLRTRSWINVTWRLWHTAARESRERGRAGDELEKRRLLLEKEQLQEFTAMASLLNDSRTTFLHAKNHAQDRLLMRKVLQHLKLHAQAERSDREFSATEACLQEEFDAFRNLRKRSLSSISAFMAEAGQRERSASARRCLQAWKSHKEVAVARSLREDAQEQRRRLQNWIGRRIPQCADARSTQLLLVFWAMRLLVTVDRRRDFTRTAVARLVSIHEEDAKGCLSAMAWLSWRVLFRLGQGLREVSASATENRKPRLRLSEPGDTQMATPDTLRGEKSVRHPTRRSQSAPSRQEKSAPSDLRSDSVDSLDSVDQEGELVDGSHTRRTEPSNVPRSLPPAHLSPEDLLRSTGAAIRELRGLGAAPPVETEVASDEDVEDVPEGGAEPETADVYEIKVFEAA